MPKLGVNIDHVATLRQARREFDPDPVEAAEICEQAGADSIVCHLREDRRHIQDKDLKALRRVVKTRLNLEMSLNQEITKIAIRLRPDQATLVPERRQEVTTEGGLDVVKYSRRIQKIFDDLHEAGIELSLFIDPVKEQIDQSAVLGIRMVEFHTGNYANAKTKVAKDRELRRLRGMTRYAQESGLIVNAGHGLKYDDTRPVAEIEGIEELNIGHSIISRAVFVGLERAVKEMAAVVKI
ncbi:MAG: pyridoxine 5'-phosphate synthase [Candidatus Omnitrophica bacterium]|nr:pyridoxine 5'-phosphate synthase [Candidatus Omnitrophota bacterium]